MLIERRCYELQPGATDAFWQAQALRPDGSLRSLLERSHGFYSETSQGVERIVSLYAYEDFQDWQTRTQQAYADPALLSYFQTVRPLIVEQESMWMRAGGCGSGEDFAQGLRRYGQSISREAVVCEWVLSLRPGSVPQAWASLQQNSMPGVLGMFSSFVGALNRVVIWQEQQAGQQWEAAQFGADWPGDCVRSVARHYLRPSPVRDLSSWRD